MQKDRHVTNPTRPAAPAAVGRVARTALGAVLLGLVVVTPVLGQDFLADGGLDGGSDVIFRDRILEREYESEVPLMDYDGRYIVVHIAENRVFVFEGGRAVWSAPAGTGTGFSLERGEHRWKFSTPRGLMRVRRKEKNPVWEAPDWHFLERGLTPPAQNSPRRKIRGGMGNSALYLGDGIAIHGTWRPQDLLDPDPEARRISHGCIRLTDEHARELLHMVDVGTPVLIF